MQRLLIAGTSILMIFSLFLRSVSSNSGSKQEYSEFHYRAQQGRVISTEEGDLYEVKKVVARHHDTFFQADEMVYDESKQLARCRGHLLIYDKDNRITGEVLEIDLKNKKATLTGRVKIVALPASRRKEQAEGKPSSAPPPANNSPGNSTNNSSSEKEGERKTLRKEMEKPVVITCDQVEYWYRQKRAVASGNLKMTQNGRVLRAEKAIYFAREEVVVLTGDVQGQDEKGQLFRAPVVRVWLAEGKEAVEAESFSGILKVKEEEEEPGPPPPSPPEQRSPS